MSQVTEKKVPSRHKKTSIGNKKMARSAANNNENARRWGKDFNGIIFLVKQKLRKHSKGTKLDKSRVQ